MTCPECRTSPPTAKATNPDATTAVSTQLTRRTAPKLICLATRTSLVHSPNGGTVTGSSQATQANIRSLLSARRRTTVSMVTQRTSSWTLRKKTSTRSTSTSTTSFPATIHELSRRSPSSCSQTEFLCTTSQTNRLGP